MAQKRHQIVPVLVPILSQEGKAGRKVRIVVISDTHNETNKLVHYIPEGDILIHCGDFTQRVDWLGLEKGKLKEKIVRQKGQVPQTFHAFNEFLSSLPHKHKIVIAGNHETGLNDIEPTVIQELLPACRYLFDESITIEGITMYGTPWTTQAMMGFSAPNGEKRQQLWDKIPQNIDILISHSPPFGIQDKNGFGKSTGCNLLLNRVKIINPKVHLFGHIHESQGVYQSETTTFINASNIMGNSVYYFDFLVE